MSEVVVEETSEAVLLQRAKSGDFAAFQQLIAGLQPRVYGLTFRMLRHAQDAEDATQLTFISLIEHLEDFREESSLATWVLRIATNHALKIIRKKRGLKTVSLDASEATDRYSDLPHPEYVAPWAKTSQELAEDRETREEIERALGELDDKYRLVFILRDLEGLSVRETAAALDISEANVKVRLLRARLALRERLTRRFGDPAQAVIPNHDHADG